MDNKNLLRIGLIVLTGAVLIYLVSRYICNKSEVQEEFFVNEEDNTDYEEIIDENKSIGEEYDEVHPGEQIGTNEVYSSLDSTEKQPTGNQYPSDCYPKDQLTAAELLPGDANSKWAQVNPSGQGELGDQNFLNAGYHVGVNTVGQTLRNANLQIRSEPPNPQVKVSPWLQSTIEPDTNRKPMEIGGCE